METLAVFHILKNGGTTLVDRYRDNATFVYQRVDDEVIFNYKQSNQTKVYVDQCQDKNIRMVYGHGVGFEWNNHLQNPVKYATILRNPIGRIMSAYNYFKLEMINMHNHISDLDIQTWIINCDRILPTPVYTQYQQFSNTKDYRTQSLRIDYGRQLDLSVQTKIYDEALENIEKLSHVLFMDDNYIEKFDNIASTFGLTPNKSVTHTHSTSQWLQEHGIDYVHFNDLYNIQKELIMETVTKDLEFYSYCKERFA